MKVIDRYKIYSHLFFWFIIVSNLLLLYTIKTTGVSTKFAENSISISWLIFFVLLIFFNKARLYVHQIKNENFGFFASSDQLSAPKIYEQILGFTKSLIGIFIYSIFILELVHPILNLLKETDAKTLFTVLKVSFYAFILILIAWDIKRLRYWPLIKKEKIGRKRKSQLEYAEKMELYSNRQFQPEEFGLMTGYEPKELEDIEIVSRSLMRGDPGAGLSGSGFSKSNIKAGSLGELNFAKVLQKNDMLDRFATYWSVQYPFKHVPGPDTGSKGDIDCVLVSNKNIYLIDLKLYAQGNLTWKTVNNGREVVAIDNNTEKWIGPPRDMSKNMYHATKRIQFKVDELGINMKVKPYVVMMPTNRGLGKVDNVFWPGNVACMTLVDFLNIIENERPYNVDTDNSEVLDSIFTWLTKDESGSAPRYKG